MTVNLDVAARNPLRSAESHAKSRLPELANQKAKRDACVLLMREKGGDVFSV